MLLGTKPLPTIQETLVWREESRKKVMIESQTSWPIPEGSTLAVCGPQLNNNDNQ